MKTSFFFIIKMSFKFYSQLYFTQLNIVRRHIKGKYRASIWNQTFIAIFLTKENFCLYTYPLRCKFDISLERNYKYFGKFPSSSLFLNHVQFCIDTLQVSLWFIDNQFLNRDSRLYENCFSNYLFLDFSIKSSSVLLKFRNSKKACLSRIRQILLTNTPRRFTE